MTGKLSNNIYPQLITLPTFEDERGFLSVWDKNVPFEVKRVFWIYGVPEGQTRAGHHRNCEEVIFAVSGSFWVNEFWLNDPARGLYIPAGNFIKLVGFSDGAVALVLCSEPYDR